MPSASSLARLLLAGWIACLGITSGCSESSAPRSEETEIGTVVLVTIDTWRRDANGFLGGLDPSPTPFLDRLAGEASVGTDAVTPVPLTGPSHWSILSGRWPWRDGVRTNGDPIPEGMGPSLAQLLASRGWRTGGFVSAAVLDRRYGFDRGFELYDDTLDFGSGTTQELETVDRPAEQTIGRAIAWLEELDATDRAFLWVHLFDPHFPYTPPGGPFPGAHPDYLGEVAHVDSQLERLDHSLERLGRGRTEGQSRSLWVVLADHGEGLGEHGEATHGIILHGATHRIPFLIAGPGVPTGRIEHPVATIDTVPTVVAVLGLEAPGTDGMDILADPSPSAGAERAIPMETLEGARMHGLAPVVGLRQGSWLWEASPKEHLWNLADDPAEAHDLAAEQPSETRRLRAVRKELGIAPFERAAPRSTETDRALRALGYLGSGAQAGQADAREYVQTGQQWFFHAIELAQAKKWDEAEALFQKFFDAYPDSPQGWIEAAFCAVGRGDLVRAEERFRRAVDLDPQNTQALLNLGNTVWQRGRPDEAEAFYTATLAIDSRDYYALYNLGTLLANRGDREAAGRAWRRFLDAYPEDERAPSLRATLASWPSAR